METKREKASSAFLILSILGMIGFWVVNFLEMGKLSLGSLCFIGATGAIAVLLANKLKMIEGMYFAFMIIAILGAISFVTLSCIDVMTLPNESFVIPDVTRRSAYFSGVIIALTFLSAIRHRLLLTALGMSYQ